MATCADCGLTVEAGHAGNEGGANLLCESCAALRRRTPPIRVTPLEFDDLELVFAWRSDPDVHRHFRRQDGPLEWDEHVDWFESRDAGRQDFVVHYDGGRVGGVSLDADDHVGIYLGEASARGRGVATAALEWLCDRFEDHTPLYAEVHEENDASRQLFQRCGFEQSGRDDEWLQYVYEPN